MKNSLFFFMILLMLPTIKVAASPNFIPGNYGLTCRECNLSSNNQLFCICQNKIQEWVETTLYIKPQCTYVENIDGNLQCTRWGTNYDISSGLDCRMAHTTVEQLICLSPQLLELDARMTTEYRLAQEHLSPFDRKTLLDEQRAWLKSRIKACNLPVNLDASDISLLYTRQECLIAIYKNRIAILNNY